MHNKGSVKIDFEKDINNPDDIKIENENRLNSYFKGSELPIDQTIKPDKKEK